MYVIIHAGLVVAAAEQLAEKPEKGSLPMNQRKIVIRIVALLLALLMATSVFGVVFSIIASAADTTVLTAVAQTGSRANEVKWPILAAVTAVFVIIICVVVPIITKKK